MVGEDGASDEPGVCVGGRDCVCGDAGHVGSDQPAGLSMETYQPLYSSNIIRADFDPEQATLLIEFTSGGTYEYRGISRETFLGLQNAQSAGAYFARQIKNRYPSEQVE